MNNPPAFPIITPDMPVAGSPGMSLRDFFAAKAMGLFGIEAEQLKDLIAGAKPRHEVVAKFCYGLADAMLAEREKGQA